MVAEVVKAGGRVIAGTDSPIFPYGLSLLMEVEHYAMGGLTPADAIRTATIVPAEAMGAAADLGSVERGKLADLTIVGRWSSPAAHARRSEWRRPSAPIVPPCESASAGVSPPIA